MRKKPGKKNEAVDSIDLALVLGYIATKDLATTEKKVAVLAQLGFSNSHMARICDTGETVIATLKSKVRRAR